MDNVTHALAGLLLAESAVELRTAREGRVPSVAFARAAAIVGVVAAELPDADLAYAGAAMGAGKLGYLLHHRGHTHTIVAALVGALLVWAVALLVRRGASSAVERRSLLFVALAGTLSHLVLDWTNNYGVHPFWPIDDRWLYGDAVFIVEPWLWIASIPALLVAARSTGTRLVLGFLLAAILAAAWAVGMVSRGAASALTIGAIAWIVVAFVTRSSHRLVLAIGAWLLVELTFFGTSRAARAAVREAAGAPAIDIAVTPAVANPLCHTALVVEQDATTYRVLSAAVGPIPALRSVDLCPVRGGAALPATARPRTATVRWEGEWSAPRTELATLARTNCEIAAALRFVRVPAWVRTAGAVELWDVRYGRGGFASITTADRPTRCPRNVPPWRPPREDVIGAE